MPRLTNNSETSNKLDFPGNPHHAPSRWRHSAAESFETDSTSGQFWDFRDMQSFAGTCTINCLSYLLSIFYRSIHAHILIRVTLKPGSLFRHPMAPNKKRVVIVDDHPLLRERLTQLINHQPDLTVTGEAESAENAIEIIQKSRPDLAIIDITLKGSSGLELIKDAKALPFNLPMLVLSMHEESLYAERALRAGAAGYITKHQTADEVLLAIRRVLAGEIYLSPVMTAKLLKGLTGTEATNIARSVDDLTDRELQVLALIGRGYTTRQIADTLQLGAATVDTYRARIKEKLGFRNATELQHFAVTWARERE